MSEAEALQWTRLARLSDGAGGKRSPKMSLPFFPLARPLKQAQALNSGELASSSASSDGQVWDSSSFRARGAV